MAKKFYVSKPKRKDVTPKTPELYKITSDAPVNENLNLQNAFNYTMYGMLIGASIGYFAGNLTLGFGIGTLTGGIIDSYMNTQKKKKREAILKAQAEKEQK